MTEAYAIGFRKTAEAYGVDPARLVKAAYRLNQNPQNSGFYFPDTFSDQVIRPKQPVPFLKRLENGIRRYALPGMPIPPGQKPLPLPKSDSFRAMLKHDMRRKAGPGGMAVQVR